MRDALLGGYVSFTGGFSMRTFRNALLAAAILAALPAMAQRQPFSPFYIGAGAGIGNLNQGPQHLINEHVDDSSNTYTVRAGWRMSPYMALEVGYYDLGKYEFNGTLLGSTN